MYSVCPSPTNGKAIIPTVVHCSFQKRLLHPGASTADILSQYISTMKSLHVVDPSGAAAERVCQPVQAYLR